MNPPVFFKGKSLRAQDLIDLEEYVLSVNSIKEGGHGVIRFYPGDTGPNIKPGRSGISCNFIIDDVIGITPSGRPVKFKANSHNPELSLLFSFANETEKTIADIFLDDIHVAIEKGDEDERDVFETNQNLQKYKLSMDLIKDDMPIDYWRNDGNSLYLGRYAIRHNKIPDMVQPPLPYCLAAVKFPSAWWNEWTEDLREALRNILDKNKENTLITPFILEIAYNFHKWPLNQLINACNILDALSVSTTVDIRNMLDEGFWTSRLQAKDFFELFSGKKTKEIPTIITKMLKEGPGIDILPSDAYSSQGPNALKFQLSEHEVKFLKIEIPASYTPKKNAEGIFYTRISLNGERMFPGVFYEDDNFKGNCGFFECEYYNKTVANGTQEGDNCSIVLDYNWQSDLRIYKSKHPFNKDTK
jgi:hypothetical protein